MSSRAFRKLHLKDAPPGDAALDEHEEDEEKEEATAVSRTKNVFDLVSYPKIARSCDSSTSFPFSQQFPPSIASLGRMTTVQ